MAERKKAKRRTAKKKKRDQKDDMVLSIVDESGEVVQTVFLPTGAKTQEIPVAAILPSVLSEKSVGKLAAAMDKQTEELAAFRRALLVEQRAHARQRRKELWLTLVGSARDVLDVAADKVAVGARFVGRKAKALIISEGKRKPATT